MRGTPAWVVPSPIEVSDLHWLAYRVYTEHGSAWVGGVIAAVVWVSGGGLGPITHRDEQPVTRNVAKAENYAAMAVDEEPGSVPLPLKSACRELDVPYREPRTSDREWANGVWRALRWLTGVEGQAAPLAVPMRRADGTTPTSDELYRAAFDAAPYRYSTPQDKIALRDRTEREAQRYQELAALISETQQRVAVA